jgi:hypothetical protein
MPKEEYRLQQSTLTEQHKPHQEGGNDSLGLPHTVHESAKPPPENPAHEGRQRTLVQLNRGEPEAVDTCFLDCVQTYAHASSCFHHPSFTPPNGGASAQVSTGVDVPVKPTVQTRDGLVRARCTSVPPS